MFDPYKKFILSSEQAMANVSKHNFMAGFVVW